MDDFFSDVPHRDDIDLSNTTEVRGSVNHLFPTKYNPAKFKVGDLCESLEV
jgi:hypothetical protein